MEADGKPAEAPAEKRDLRRELEAVKAAIKKQDAATRANLSGKFRVG